MKYHDTTEINSLSLPADTMPGNGSLEVFSRGTRNILWITVRDGRTLILKGLPENLRNHPEEVSRLRKEYALGIRINHPGVVGVYGFETLPDIGPVIVMEYIDGITLHDFLNEEQPQALEVRLKIACRIADALGHIHSFGVSHRDLKPDNILITKRNDAKIIDFGLGDSEDAATYKYSLATAEFGAPEQQQPYAADSTADVYSFGRILQHLLPEKRFRKLRDACQSPLPQERPTIKEVSEALLSSYQNKDRYSLRRYIIASLALLVIGITGYFALTRVVATRQAEVNPPQTAATPDYDAICNEYIQKASDVIEELGPAFDPATGRIDEQISRARATQIPQLCNELLEALINAGCPYDEMNRLTQLFLDETEKAYNRIDGINE